jgi:hypothetical protein
MSRRTGLAADAGPRYLTLQREEIETVVMANRSESFLLAYKEQRW